MAKLVKDSISVRSEISSKVLSNRDTSFVGISVLDDNKYDNSNENRYVVKFHDRTFISGRQKMHKMSYLPKHSEKFPLSASKSELSSNRIFQGVCLPNTCSVVSGVS